MYEAFQGCVRLSTAVDAWLGLRGNDRAWLSQARACHRVGVTIVDAVDSDSGLGSSRLHAMARGGLPLLWLLAYMSATRIKLGTIHIIVGSQKVGEEVI